MRDVGNPTHYTMIHFVGDSIIVEGATDSLFPGLVNLRGTFSGSRRSIHQDA
jgi:lipopolysaccharide transport system ATP-binding protein/teichoic acid transport system ATP-binding protein